MCVSTDRLFWREEDPLHPLTLSLTHTHTPQRRSRNSIDIPGNSLSFPTQSSLSPSLLLSFALMNVDPLRPPAEGYLQGGPLRQLRPPSLQKTLQTCSSWRKCNKPSFICVLRLLWFVLKSLCGSTWSKAASSDSHVTQTLCFSRSANANCWFIFLCFLSTCTEPRVNTWRWN